MRIKKTIPVLNLCTLLGFIAFSFSSCLGPKKIDKWVSKKYGDSIAISKKKSDFISVKSNQTFRINTPSITEKRTSNILPLLFYWQWDYKNTCTLNPQIAVNNFTSTVATYANKTLKEKLNGKRIEFTIENIPTVFALDDKAHLVWFIYAYGWDDFSIQPQKTDMVVSYKIFNTDNTEAKNGTIKIPDINKGFALRMFQSLRNKTWEHLDQYNSNITLMSRQVIDQLIKEL
jgi:hypothetical protein